MLALVLDFNTSPTSHARSAVTKVVHDTCTSVLMIMSMLINYDTYVSHKATVKTEYMNIKIINVVHDTIKRCNNTQVY